MRTLRLFFLWLIIALMLGMSIQPVHAQNLSFEVPKQEVVVFVNSDGSVSLDYTITFKNLPGRDAIDIVDIGLPNSNYDLKSISAEIDGKPATLIRPSEYVNPGVEIHLGSNAIQPGQTGTLHVYVGKVERALGKSTLQEAEEYASLVITPNNFDRNFTRGTTEYYFTIVLPTGLKPEEPRYHTPSGNWPGSNEPVESGFDNQGRVYYTWYAEKANVYTPYKFGASFPIRLVPAQVVVATETPNLRTVDFEAIIGTLCTAGFVGFFFIIPILSAVAANRRKLQYLPPKIAVEGHGIKRGLTAVEAAVLMEQPLDKVLTMILFSVLKKGAAIVESREPLVLKISDPLPENLQPYEMTFLEAFKQTNKKLKEAKLQDTVIGLIKSVSEKMKGFSRKETIDYYKTIMEKAWQQVAAAETPEVKSDVYEQVMDWTMVDRRWDDRTREVFQSGPVRVPTWWWRYDPVIRSAPSTSGGGMAKTTIPTPTGGGSVTLPKLPGSDFAASMVKGVQSFSSGVLGNVNTFTERITNKTNPPPKPSSYSGRSGGGGGGCACACACAGCACACAGGGR
ncbi:hypothetical protein [Bellilinea caldifistulae]|uniref:DUF2207 domain-containing protein n=1 Tax=Bellilinea caldifistulae TaxID=360411 RepID=A0A0P6X6E3_9CHLR|nr:hypothetical protein [Bellilinea caldifistulae]KPL74942.1 hypothetical protein AC812_10520 [Bellilinea caldifistulae]